MRMRYLNSFLYIVIAASAAGFLSLEADAQSNDQRYPTPVTRSEVRGRIEARPVGDARLTQHFYVFDGEQGDIFVNIVAENFTGDIDIFIQDGLRLLSKIVFYADYQNNETGRVLYLRKRERLLLRVQGRTPNDDPASYVIKFAGSFLAVNAADFPDAPELPVITRSEPVRTEGPAREEARAETRRTETAPVRAERAEAESRPGVPARKEETAVVRKEEVPAKEEETPAAPRGETATPRAPEREAARSAAPRARILKLVIEFTDGSRIERPMTEISRFSVEGDTLVVLPKGGPVRRYSMATVNRVSIE